MTKPHEDAADPHPHAPAASRLIAAHMLANVLIQGSWYGVAAMMPVLARKRFDATDWQTVMVTAALPTLMLASIFWGDLLRRCSIRTYLLIHWSAAMLPLAAGALAQNFWQLLAAHVLAAAGSSGWSPVAGDLLKGFYRDNVRGRALGLVSSAMFAGWMLMSFAIGRALDHDENIFRLYLPATAVSYLCGVLILRHLVKRTGIDHHGRRPLTAISEPRASARASSRTTTEPRASARADNQMAQAYGAVPPGPTGTPLPLPAVEEPPLGLRRLLDPIIHARAILKADRSFARYEAAS
jgi:MFS family permease